jgi:hypothetical protein
VRAQVRGVAGHAARVHRAQRPQPSSSHAARSRCPLRIGRRCVTMPRMLPCSPPLAPGGLAEPSLAGRCVTSCAAAKRQPPAVHAFERTAEAPLTRAVVVGMLSRCQESRACHLARASSSAHRARRWTLSLASRQLRPSWSEPRASWRTRSLWRRKTAWFCWRWIGPTCAAAHCHSLVTFALYPRPSCVPRCLCAHACLPAGAGRPAGCLFGRQAYLGRRRRAATDLGGVRGHGLGSLGGDVQCGAWGWHTALLVMTVDRGAVVCKVARSRSLVHRRAIRKHAFVFQEPTTSYSCRDP